jgi:hypothetical protein
MKNLLQNAKQEIEQLRRQNEILRAKVETMDLFALTLRTEPKYPSQGYGEDVAWLLGKARIGSKAMTPTPDDAMPDEIYVYKEGRTRLFAAKPMYNGNSPFHDSLGSVKYTRADKPYADDARKAHEWLERHVAMPHDIKTIVYSALSAASKEQEKGNE